MDRTVGPYQLGESVGTLPFGELVTATHPARSEPLAILLLDEQLARDHRFRGLLRLEVARAGGLRHPAVARAVEVGDHGGAPYVVYERPADARTLARAYAEGDPPAREHVAALMQRMAEGLDAAHARRLVHGALGPTTVLVGRDRDAAVVGLALIGAVDEAGLTSVVAERIEAALTAPEQRAAGRRGLASADGYALGVLAAALLRVQPPPAGPADAVGLVLGRQHAADPAARYPSCGAFAGALAEALASAAAPSLPTGPAEAERSATPEPARPTAASPPTPTPTPPADAAGLPPREASATNAETPAPAPLPFAAPLPHSEETEGRDDAGGLPAAPRLAPAPSAATHGEAVRPREIPAGVPPSVSREHRAPGLEDGGAPRSDGEDAPAGAPLAPGLCTDEPVVATTSVTRAAPSEAMRAAVAPAEPRDLIGEMLGMAAERAPWLDELLNRYAPAGKLGPLPVGLAVAGALVVLLALGGQLWPATVVAAIVAILYGVPRLSAALTASERGSLEAVRVRGPARLRRTAPDRGGTPELVLLNGGLTLNLRDAEYAALAEAAVAHTVEQPDAAFGGVRPVVIDYELAGAIVTYLEPGRTLLDVRTPNGGVIVRRAPYSGEPGDRLWSPGVVNRGVPSVEPADLGGAPSAPGERQAPWSGPTFATGRPAGSATILPMPAAVRERLRLAAQTTERTAAGVVAAMVLTLLILPNVFDFFGLMMAVFVCILLVQARGASIGRALTLRGAREATTLTRAVGPVAVSRYRSGKTHQHRIRLSDGAVVKVDRATHDRLARAGEVRVAPSWLPNWSRQTSEGYLESEHELAGATVIYVAPGWLLLEIRDQHGALLYRDPALHDGDLG